MKRILISFLNFERVCRQKRHAWFGSMSYLKIIVVHHNNNLNQIYAKFVPIAIYPYDTS